MINLNTSLAASVNTKNTQIVNFEQLNQYEFIPKRVQVQHVAIDPGSFISSSTTLYCF